MTFVAFCNEHNLHCRKSSHYFSGVKVLVGNLQLCFRRIGGSGEPGSDYGSDHGIDNVSDRGKDHGSDNGSDHGRDRRCNRGSHPP